ncbi:MAG: DUF5110 domain-containing protein [Lachnospiraceae bacterium]|nr:DUF5110 domain-containing protein [Lachnospiraceae bacterium]
MQRHTDMTADGIIHVSYTGSEYPVKDLCDFDPLDFEYDGIVVLKQTKVRLTPKTLYRFETDGEPVVRKKMTANGEVSYIENMHSIPAGKSYNAQIDFEIGNDEMLLGLGQYEDGILDYRNRTEYLYQSNMRIAVPFLVTTGHYAILIDSESNMIFRSSNNRISFEIDTCDTVSYYVFLAEKTEDLIRKLYKVTGMPSMLPRWVFGYIQSKERYENGDELTETAARFRDLKIPIDCLVQDWYTWEEGLWGEKKFDKKRYPDLPATINTLHDKGIRLMVSIWPNMSPSSENYRQFEKEGLLLPNSNVYDAFDEKARNIYWEQCRAEIMSSGTDALWCDNSEPFSDSDWSGHTKKPEKERYITVTDTSKQSMDPQKLNSYALYHAKGIYENWRRSYPEKRVVNLTRSGYTGSWQYGTILWSGDITARFETLKKQITEGIKASLSGMAYWTYDIGGFFVVNDKYENRGCNDKDHKPLWFWHGDYNDGVDDPAYRELYVRWLQMGTFLPVFRSHGTDTPREPWQFGEPGDMFYDTIVKFIRLRYKLIPYIYSLAASVHRNGSVMMRSLLIDFPCDETVRTIYDEYMFGPSFLVAPVTDPMYYAPGSQELSDTQKSRRVYLPKGCGWYDFYTNEFHDGGVWIDADAPLSKMPLFVKAGSVIPMSDNDQYNTDNSKTDRIIVYEGCDCSFELYTDAGDGYGFEKEQFCLTSLSYTEADHTLRITGQEGELPYYTSFKVEHIRPCGI